MDNFLNNTLPNNLHVLNYSDQICPDQFVAEFIYNTVTRLWEFQNNNICSTTNNRSSIDYSKILNNDTILIILESPHISEYNPAGIPIGPAMGNTGQLFDKHFENIVNKSINLKSNTGLNQKLTYDIVFLNAVQYQASQGKHLTNCANKKNRDKNWLYFWNNGFSNDLFNRIQSFAKKKIIINLCTKGPGNLTNFVSIELKANNLPFFHGPHPASWFNMKNRHIN